MPSANGVYSLPSGYLAVEGTTIQPSQHNPPLEDIAAALTLRLSRDGTAPMMGGLKGIAGTAPIPSYAFQTDPTTGIFKTTNGLGISVAGTQVAEFTAAGMASGVRMLGELVPWTLLTCPALFVFPFGQTLSRTTYAALWAQAQIEIASGNSFFNNGDGSTTFGIGDLRGRVFACLDTMGGSDAARLASSPSMGSRGTIGGAGGVAAHANSLAELPTGITSTGTFSLSSGNLVTDAGGSFSTFSNGTGGATQWQAWNPGSNPSHVSPNASGTVTSNNTGAGAHENVQPTMMLQAIMFAGA